ncbi:hypothetical protein BVAVS116_H0018 (plasmid) [Borreliella valaisiana VS116]|uniref:Uncharacterized protein n=1 Tax=Borreliella valaisiana VS116 TaxID=445987 RepID=C0R975_BORVA|nr:hypothetical protein BVAVS116_H0018 [Borreliella valaisiana VS116]
MVIIFFRKDTLSNFYLVFFIFVVGSAIILMILCLLFINNFKI